MSVKSAGIEQEKDAMKMTITIVLVEDGEKSRG